MVKVGILYVCTGKYSCYWNDFYKYCEKNFLSDTEKHYFVWTDDQEIIQMSKENRNIHIYYQEVEEWPFPTLKRFEYFLRAEEELRGMDYLMYMNANLIVLQPVTNEEFLPQKEELFVTMHPGFYGKTVSEFGYDRNPACSAYVEEGLGEFYFAGGLNGGKSEAYLELIKELDRRTKKDYEKGIIALWHDESQLNRYMIDCTKKYKIISPAYLYPQGWELPFEKKILLLDKNNMGGHDTMRGIK